MEEQPLSNISESVAKQPKRGIIRTLARMTQEGERPRPSDQSVKSFNSFHESFRNFPVLSRLYYHKLYNKPPSKRLLYANLCETMEAVGFKNMPFIVICEDFPVYSLLVELCSQNESTWSVSP